MLRFALLAGLDLLGRQRHEHVLPRRREGDIEANKPKTSKHKCRRNESISLSLSLSLFLYLYVGLNKSFPISSEVYSKYVYYNRIEYGTIIFVLIEVVPYGFDVGLIPGGSWNLVTTYRRT